MGADLPGPRASSTLIDLLAHPHRIDATPAAARIACQIERGGPITFERFMDLALYEPEVGYYTRPRDSVTTHDSRLVTTHDSSRLTTHDSRLVTTHDYLTSPEIHPAFGALLCSQFEEMWRHLGQPDPFWLVEGGPGSAVFAGDVRSTAQGAFPRFAAALQLALIERSPALRAQQVSRLASWGNRVRWLDPSGADWPTAGLGSGCVFANELLDALPVHRVVMAEGGLLETYVTVRDGELQEVDDSVSRSSLATQIAAGGGRLAVGQRAEVNVEALRWVRSAASLLDRGYLLLLDYGEPAAELYSPKHPRGTLRCYWHHTLNEDPLARVGWQDITAHVDFSAVARAALGADLVLLGATRQADLLGRLGLPLLAEQIEGRVAGRAEQRVQRRALQQLVDPHGLGRILALAFAKQASENPLTGFTRATPAQPPFVPGMWHPQV